MLDWFPRDVGCWAGNVMLSFAQAVDSHTINNKTFRVSTATGQPVDGSFRVGDVGHTLLFAPDEDWERGAEYTVSVDGVAAKDGAAVEPMSWTFRVATDRFGGPYVMNGGMVTLKNIT